jgi:hypothetical protein
VVELVDIRVLEARAKVREGSSPFLGTKHRRFIMKEAIFENIYNKEKFVSRGKRDSKFIDGVEYIKLFKKDTLREVFVRKDFVRKVNK